MLDSGFKTFIFCLSFVISCQNIPFLGHDEEDRSLLNDTLSLLLISQSISSSNAGSSSNTVPETCSGTGGGPSGEKETISKLHGGYEYTTGLTQVTSNRQDAFVYRKTGDRFDWCYYYDRSSADTKGRVLELDLNGNEMFVAFSTDGGNAGFRATSGAVQNSYGSGGGPAVTFLARINPENGEIKNATYLASRLGADNNYRVNTLRPRSITIQSDRVIFIGETAADRGEARDSIAKGEDCRDPGTGNELKRTVIMPLDLSRNTPYSATCEIVPEGSF